MKNKKLKIAFGIFFASVGLSLLVGILFLQSRYFAAFLKRNISERAPKSLGIVGDFDTVKLYLFPPGIGVTNPKVRMQRENISKLPIEASIEAQELRLHFEPIQMLSGTVQVSKLVIKDGSVIASVGAEVYQPKPVKKKTNPLQWNELLELQINGVEFENTFLSVETELPNRPEKTIHAELLVKHLSADKTRINNKAVLRSSALVNDVKLDVPEDVADLPIHEASELEWNLELTDEGMKLSPLRLQLLGLELKTEGKIKGNILDPNSPLNFELDAKLNSDLETFFSDNEMSDEVSGAVEAGLSVRGDLKKIEKTLKGKYHVFGKSLRWKDATASALEGEGELDLNADTLEIDRIRIFEKQNRDQGGEVQVSEALLSLKNPLDGLRAKVKLDRAPIRWAGAVAMKAVYPMFGEVSGSAEISSSKARLQIKPDLEVKGFALTNQKYHKERPLHYILKPRETVRVKGTIVSQSGKLDFQQVAVTLKGTKLDVGGSLGGKAGFDLHAKGNLELADFQEIAEIPIRGSGPLNAWVHGDEEGVVIDFDPDLQNAEYVGLKVGEVKGRVTYDEGADELRFAGIHAKNGKTFYSVEDGLIDLSDASELRLPFTIHSGRVEDLVVILGSVVKNVSWFPVDLKGEVHGSVNIGGKTAFAEMQIDSQLEGVDWVLMGERARKVKMNLGYDRGTYYARNVSLFKTGGSIQGFIDFDSKKDHLDWSFATEAFSLSDIDFFQRLEIPARSKIEVKSTGTGKTDHLVSNTSGKFFQTQIKGETLEPTSLNLDVSESTLRASLDVFGGRLHSSLRYSLTPKQPSNLSIEFNDFDFSPAILILNPKLMDDPNLLGLVDGRFQFDFLSTQSELARGEMLLKKYVLKKTGFSLALAEPIQTAIQLGYFSVSPAHFRFNGSELVLSGEGRRGEVDLDVKGTMDLGIAEMFTSAIQKIEGKAQTDLHITGSFKDLRLNGDFNFSNASLLMRWLQTPFEEMDGTIRIRKNVVLIDNIDSYLGEEVFAMSGKIETSTQKFPSMDLRMQFDDNKIKMSPIELAHVRGTAFVKGDHPPYQITGNMDVMQALWTKSFSQSGTASSGAERFAPTDTNQQASSTLFNMDLNINAPQKFYVRNEVMDGEFRGRVRMIGTPENPKLLGEGQLVQGKVLFRDRPFVLDSVKINFDDPYAINPKFNASATSEINQYKIRVLAYGKSSSWKADFSSTPYLPEGEIFSLLASGLTTSQSNRFVSRDRSFVNQGEAASLVLHSLDFGKDVQSKTGFQFDVEEAVDNQSANSIFKPGGPGGTDSNVAAPKLVIKRQLGRRVGVGFGSTVGVGNQVQREVNAEYKLNSSVSVLGVWNNIEEANTRETRTSFGLDLKLNRRFK